MREPTHPFRGYYSVRHSRFADGCLQPADCRNQVSRGVAFYDVTGSPYGQRLSYEPQGIMLADHQNLDFRILCMDYSRSLDAVHDRHCDIDQDSTRFCRAAPSRRSQRRCHIQRKSRYPVELKEDCKSGGERPRYHPPLAHEFFSAPHISTPGVIPFTVSSC